MPVVRPGHKHKMVLSAYVHLRSAVLCPRPLSHTSTWPTHAFICPSTQSSSHLPVRSLVCLSIRQPAHPFACVHTRPLVHPPARPFARPSAHSFARPFVHPCAHLSAHPFVRPSVSLTIRPFIHGLVCPGIRSSTCLIVRVFSVRHRRLELQPQDLLDQLLVLMIIVER